MIVGDNQLERRLRQPCLFGEDAHGKAIGLYNSNENNSNVTGWMTPSLSCGKRAGQVDRQLRRYVRSHRPYCACCVGGDQDQRWEFGPIKDYVLGSDKEDFVAALKEKATPTTG
jgi:hypothetical protein